MALIDHQNKTIHCKIVYYGPGMGGKTSCLQSIHQQLPEANRSELLSKATETERTLFFDLIHPQFQDLAGWPIRFHLYTVPGAVLYERCRMEVLRGADGVVFVADSQRVKIAENVRSLSELAFMLDLQKKLFARFPLVLQYNKRDVPNALPVERIDQHLNLLPWPRFLSIAPKHQGVIEAFDAVCQRVRDTLLPSGVSTGETPVHLHPLVDDWLTLYEAAHKEAGCR